MLGTALQRATTARPASAPSIVPPAPAIVRDAPQKPAAATQLAALQRPVPSSLPDHLAMVLTQQEPGYLGDGWLHASSLFELCSMKRILSLRSPQPTVVTPADRMRWDIGHAVQAWVSHRYLGPMGRLYGDWRCTWCKVVVVGPMPGDCPACARPGPWRYEEREVKQHELRVCGHLDGMDLDPTREGLGVLEIKTIDGNMFRYKLGAALEEHVWRTQLYCWLAGLKWGRVFYISMAYEKGKSPFKEFLVDADDAAVEAQVRQVVAEIRAGGVRACDSVMAPRAVLCSKRRECWRIPG